MATLAKLNVNGDVQYSNPDGSWNHNGGVHANTNPEADTAHPQPTDNQMSWTEVTPSSTDDNRATITEWKFLNEGIQIKGKCHTRHTEKVPSGKNIEMTIFVTKTGGKFNSGEAAVSYSDGNSAELSKPVPFYDYVTFESP